MPAALDALRGESPRMVAIRADLARLLGRPSIAGRLPPILILGETGTRKGLLARQDLCFEWPDGQTGPSNIENSFVDPRRVGVAGEP